MTAQAWDINKIIKDRTGIDLLRLLSEEIPGTELNSLLLSVFDRVTSDTSPAGLLQAYRQNRFVQPADGDMLTLRAKELQTLQLLNTHGFRPVELSPVSILGSCSVLGTVDQKKVLSATRGTEVLADATNALAIHVAHQIRVANQKVSDHKEVAVTLRYCTTHRHLRTPPVKVKGHSAHFVIACWVTAGRDEGNFIFEKRSLTEQLRTLNAVVKEVFHQEIDHVKLKPRKGYDHRLAPLLCEELRNALGKDLSVEIDDQSPDNDYYCGVQYKAYIRLEGNLIEVADGGFTDWTQQLLANKKERFLISGLGLEFLTKIT